MNFTAMREISILKEMNHENIVKVNLRYNNIVKVIYLAIYIVNYSKLT
jgi:hypothetical protein